VRAVNRALVAAVAAQLNGGTGVLERAAAEGQRLLYTLDAQYPAAVREILTYPLVEAWAMQCLRWPGNADADLNRAHLAGLAAAAALRAGIEAELAVPVRGGAVYLPAAGAFEVAAGTGPIARVRVSASGITAARGLRKWRTVRRITAMGMSATVDDLDPFRDCQAWTATGRLATTAWESWRLRLAAASTRLATELPGYSSVIGAGLRSVIPILPSAANRRLSGISRQAFGAVALALPDDPGSMSELLLHEMQHVKLAALGDLYDLVDRADGSRFLVPWRSDARPIEGLLHGTYAHLAIAELWRFRARAAPHGPAPERYRTYRSWVEDAIDTMLNAGSLLPAGERFVEGMRATVKGWADD
jgi:uncharacterized protein